MIGDRGRIRQILTNLIGNAVKFTDAGEVTVRVRAAPAPHPQGKVPIRVTVEDTGIGIAPEMQSHIFGEFNQVDSDATRRFDGTGLGLAITQACGVEAGGADGGRDLAYVRTGQGVRLRLCDPAGDRPGAGAGAAPPGGAAAQTGAAAGSGGGGQQDQPAGVPQHAQGVDLDLELVENGFLCVEAYKRRVPDLIFTDISMPEMDGTEARRRFAPSRPGLACRPCRSSP
jgi:hypothetical protein